MLRVGSLSSAWRGALALFSAQLLLTSLAVADDAQQPPEDEPGPGAVDDSRWTETEAHGEHHPGPAEGGPPGHMRRKHHGHAGSREGRPGRGHDSHRRKRPDGHVPGHGHHGGVRGKGHGHGHGMCPCRHQGHDSDYHERHADAPAASAHDVEPTPARPGAREHEGWYLRIATGFSGYSNILHTSSIDAMITGVGSASELALGGTVGRGVVLGGGFYSVGVLAWSLKAEDPDFVLPQGLDPTLSSFNLVGPFLDIYPDPHKGFHIQAALGLALLMGNTLESSQLNLDLQGLGGGMMLGIGHEWWIDDQWSFGILGRAMVGYVRSRDEFDVGRGHIVTTTPGVLATFTYH